MILESIFNLGQNSILIFYTFSIINISKLISTCQFNLIFNVSDKRQLPVVSLDLWLGNHYVVFQWCKKDIWIDVLLLIIVFYPQFLGGPPVVLVWLSWDFLGLSMSMHYGLTSAWPLCVWSMQQPYDWIPTARVIVSTAQILSMSRVVVDWFQQMLMQL